MNDEWVEGEGYSKKVLFTEDDLEAEGVRIQLVRIPPKTRVDPHYHKSQTEVYNVQKGKAILGIGQDRHEVSEGETLICEPGEIHYVINDSKVPFRLLVVKTNYKEEDTYWDSGEEGDKS